MRLGGGGRIEVLGTKHRSKVLRSIAMLSLFGSPAHSTFARQRNWSQRASNSVFSKFVSFISLLARFRGRLRGSIIGLPGYQTGCDCRGFPKNGAGMRTL